MGDYAAAGGMEEAGAAALQARREGKGDLEVLDALEVAERAYEASHQEQPTAVAAAAAAAVAAHGAAAAGGRQRAKGQCSRGCQQSGQGAIWCDVCGVCASYLPVQELGICLPQPSIWHSPTNVHVHCFPLRPRRRRHRQRDAAAGD